jgi:hypothetical protein
MARPPPRHCSVIPTACPFCHPAGCDFCHPAGRYFCHPAIRPRSPCLGRARPSRAWHDAAPGSESGARVKPRHDRVDGLRPLAPVSPRFDRGAHASAGRGHRGLGHRCRPRIGVGARMKPRHDTVGTASPTCSRLPGTRLRRLIPPAGAVTLGMDAAPGSRSGAWLEGDMRRWAILERGTSGQGGRRLLGDAVESQRG